MVQLLGAGQDTVLITATGVMMKIVKKDGKLLSIARILLSMVTLGIMLASFFFYSPKNDPLAIGFDPQLGQTLVYGGLVLSIALFAWKWPVSGGVISILYGSYKILEYARLFEHPLTLVPAIAYFILYGLFIAGGVLIVRAGLRIKTVRPPESDIDIRIRRAARIATVAPVAVATAYSLILALLLILGIIPYVPGSLLSFAIIFFPFILAIVFLAWKSPAPGGLLVVLTGILMLALILSANEASVFKVPYAAFIGVYMFGGTLNLAVAFPARNLKRGGG